MILCSSFLRAPRAGWNDKVFPPLGHKAGLHVQRNYSDSFGNGKPFGAEVITQEINPPFGHAYLGPKQDYRYDT